MVFRVREVHDLACSGRRVHVLDFPRFRVGVHLPQVIAGIRTRFVPAKFLLLAHDRTYVVLFGSSSSGKLGTTNSRDPPAVRP